MINVYGSMFLKKQNFVLVLFLFSVILGEFEL